ncbi:MAG: hypothetical protein HOP18_18825 [Deltaproteobacteria bacterium]|nr:hypothetical protein [Deltaproteobacteria bacterium]
MKNPQKRSGRSSAKATALVSATKAPARIDEATLLSDLRTLIQSARQRIATAVNSTYTLLCWQVGRCLLRENLQQGRAAYGKQILATVSQELIYEFGQAFTLRSLYRAIQFRQCFSDQEIVSTASTQLSCYQSRTRWPAILCREDQP